MLTEIGFDGDFIAEISVSEGSLLVKVPGDDHPARLIPTEALRFTSLESGNQFVFNTDDSGQVIGLTVAERFQLEKIN
jgi:hypothetical protein